MADLDPYSAGVLSKLQLDAKQTPFMNPALIAYLRGVGMTLSSAEDTRARNKGDVERDYQRDTEDTERNASMAKRNLTNRLVSRGVLQSGEANTRFTEGDQAKDRQLASVATRKADRLTAVDSAYRGVEDSLRQGTTERLLSAEQDEANRKAVEEAQRKQAQAMTDFYDRQAR
jgi:hypothetical protein